jgi:hypothetical protein
MTPGLTRHYLYAISQDPLRVAIAMPLTDTGRGGQIDL